MYVFFVWLLLDDDVQASVENRKLNVCLQVDGKHNGEVHNKAPRRLRRALAGRWVGEQGGLELRYWRGNT